MKRTPSPALESTETIALGALLREVLAEERAGLLRDAQIDPSLDVTLMARVPTAAAPSPPETLSERRLRLVRASNPATGREAVA